MHPKELTNRIESLIDSNNYDEAASLFITSTNTELTIVHDRVGKHFEDDKDERDIYTVTMKRNGRSISFKFGAAIVDREHWTVKDVYTTYGGNPTVNKVKAFGGLYNYYDKKEAVQMSLRVNSNLGTAKHHPRKEPKAYSILSCLTKYHPDTFENFCSEFGYDTDSKKAEKTYYAVLKEFADLSSLYSSEELEAMSRIN